MSEIKTLSFFGENGITSTSANHIANLAKEAVRKVHERLASIRCYTEKVGLLTSDKQAILKQGWEDKDIDALPTLVKSISDANALIAFLREAIKEKERKMKEAEKWRDEAEIKKLSELYQALVARKPVKPDYPTEESVRQSWSVGEQEKYLSLEAEAAAIGKFIHEDGHLSLARIDLMQKEQNPSRIDLNGSETIVHTYEPTVQWFTIDSVFNSLQKRYREVQAELNGMKKRVDDYIFTEKMRIDTEYASAMREWNRELDEERDLEERFHEEEEIRRNELINQVKNLKIVIPNRFRSLYESLTK